MAVGLTPKYTEQFSQPYFSTQQFLMLCLYTAQELEWNVEYFSNAGLIAYTNNGFAKFNAEFKIIIDGHAASLLSSSTGSEFFDLGKNKKTVQKFIGKFEELRHQYSFQFLQDRYDEISSQLIPESQDILRLPPPSGLDIFKDMLAFIKPVEGYFFTPILLVANVVVFIIMALNGVQIMEPLTKDLIAWGGNVRNLTMNGEWWRLFTCCFLHAGVLHLLMNMFALLYIGILLEPMLGKWRFISAYVLTGIFASVASLWWHGLTVSVGASGAIFGMYGVFIALLTTNLVEKSTRKPLLISIMVFVIYNLLNGVKGQVDNAAHIGGLASGIVAGYIFAVNMKKNESPGMGIAGIVILAILVFTSSFFIIKKIYPGFNTYSSFIKKMTANENTSFTVYDLADTMQVKDKLEIINRNAILKTNENITLIDSLNRLSLPNDNKKFIAYLKKYFAIRLKIYQLIYKSAEEKTDTYKGEINKYEAEIGKLNMGLEK